MVASYLMSNVMWTFIALNFHQLTDSEAQLNKINVNNHKTNNYAGRLSNIEAPSFMSLL